MRPVVAIVFLAAAGLAGCAQYDGRQATVLHQTIPAGHSIAMSPNLVASYTLTDVAYGDPAPTMPRREPHIAPTIFPGVQGYSTERDRSERQPGGNALAQNLLAPQNSVRAAVGEPPLTWSTELAGVAQEWANHLIATGAFQHHRGGPYGENLYDITGGTATPRHVVSAWTNEIRDYDAQANSCIGDSDCGHYTQIVWSTTRAVGCALAAAANRQVWVCEYYPAGNVIGYRPYRLASN